MRYAMASLLLILAGCASATPTSISPEDFHEVVVDEDVFVLDTHIPEQQHIEGTDAFIPYNELRIREDELPADRDTPIAVYCRSGSMSWEAAQTLSDMGYTTVYDLRGGANAWRAAGLPFSEGRI